MGTKQPHTRHPTLMCVQTRPLSFMLTEACPYALPPPHSSTAALVRTSIMGPECRVWLLALSHWLTWHCYLPPCQMKQQALCLMVGWYRRHCWPFIHDGHRESIIFKVISTTTSHDLLCFYHTTTITITSQKNTIVDISFKRFFFVCFFLQLTTNQNPLDFNARAL